MILNPGQNTAVLNMNEEISFSPIGPNNNFN